ncbi:MAG: YegS/Rv2252/BmrU family lipid kinase [Proteobacteria bacterium]|nr:YegS/Rv2252/BmrU family lipid kinase [Pseudomonadota bacterium]
MNILLIGNPISSGGHAGKRIKKLSLLLEERGHNVSSYLTRFAGDGKEMISSLCLGMDRAVVVGGDGTLNEIINGLESSFTCPILHFPTGNANLLAQDLKLPQRFSRVVDLIEQGKTIMADVGVMNESRFLMVCGMGFDARVTEEVKKVRKGKVSNLSYVLPFFRAMKTMSQAPLTVRIDGKAIEAQGQAVLVCNVRNYAGICEIAYDAGVTTGGLDVVVLPGENLLSLLSYLAYAKFSRITRLKDVVYLKAEKQVIIQSESLIPVELDGDFHGRHTQVTIDIIKGLVPLIVP